MNSNRANSNKKKKGSKNKKDMHRKQVAVFKKVYNITM